MQSRDTFWKIILTEIMRNRMTLPLRPLILTRAPAADIPPDMVAACFAARLYISVMSDQRQITRRKLDRALLTAVQAPVRLLVLLLLLGSTNSQMQWHGVVCCWYAAGKCVTAYSARNGH
jgi:hypothetical protein